VGSECGNTGFRDSQGCARVLGVAAIPDAKQLRQFWRRLLLSRSVQRQVFRRHLACRNKLVVFFSENLHVAILDGKLEHRNLAARNELCRYRAAYQIRELFLAAGNILLGLLPAVLIFPAFRLYRNDVLPSGPVDANIQFVDFDLPYSPNGCPQVILKRIRGDAEKYIHQPVVPDLRQERLFVTKGIGADDLGSRVGNLHDDQVFPRHNADRPNEPKRVLGDTLPLNYPLVSVRRCIRDSARKLLSELEGVNRVSEVLWARYPQILRNFLELIAIKTDLNGTRLVVAPKNLLNNRRVTILSLTRHLGTLPVGQSPLRPSQSILGDRGSHQLLFRHIEVSNLALTNRQNVPTNRPEPP